MNQATSSRVRRVAKTTPLRARLQVEQLEARDVPSTFNLTPLVQVSSTSPFDGNPIEANDPAFTLNSEVEPYVAVDPTNPNHLVGAWIQDFARGIVAGVSFNGGNSWQSVVIPGATVASGGAYPHSSDPWVTFARNGDVYLSLIAHDFPDAEGDTVMVSKSHDGGLTWGAPTAIAPVNKNVEHDKESITADPTDSRFAYAAWTRFENSRGTAMFSRTTDGGQTWEPARAILDPGGNNVSEYFQIVVLPDGTLLNAFVQSTYKNDAGGVNHFDFKLALMRSTDHGQTWQLSATPAADILPLNDTLNIPGAGGVPNPDGGLGIDAHNWSFDVAMNPANGKLYAVWQDARFSNFQYTDTAFSMSTDGGFTWSAPIKINQTPDNIPVGNRQAFLPHVAVNQDGVVAVTYYDFRNNTPAPGLPTDLWMVHAHPSDGLTNPASWSSENRMTPASFNMQNAPQRAGYFIGDYEGLVAEGKSFGAFFSMPSGTNSSKIFFRDPLPANVNTDTEGDIHNETTIAVNPTNPLNLIGSSNEYEVDVLGNGQLHYTAHPHAHVTFDGGQTWANYPIPFQGYNSVFDPSVSFDADGTAYFGGVARTHSANFQHSPEVNIGDDIIVSHSTDGGQTWSAPVRVAKGNGASGDKVRETDNDKDYIAAWGHGNAIVTWTRNTWGPQGEPVNAPVLASVTHDGGNTWTDPVQISGPTGFFAVPTVAADGSIYVAFTSNNSFLGLDSREHYEVVRVDPATGQALGAPVDVGLIYDGGNDYPRSVDGGRTYQDSEFHTWPGGNITADPTNALHLAVVWSDMRNNPYPDGVLPSLDPYQVQTNSDIVVSQSFDGGLHWSAPTAITTPNDQFQPWGAYDASGRLQIGYYDRSYDPANHKYGYSLASETVPGSLIFTVQQVTTALSDPTMGDALLPVTVNSNFPNATLGIGDYSGIAVTPMGVAALWTDLRMPSTIPVFPGSGEDAFFALVDPPGSAAGGTI